MTNQEKKLLRACIKTLDIGVAFHLVVTYIRKWAACSVKHGAPDVLRRENSDLSHPWLIECLYSNLKQKVGKTRVSGSCTIGFTKNTLHGFLIFRFITQQLTNCFVVFLFKRIIQMITCMCLYLYIFRSNHVIANSFFNF